MSPRDSVDLGKGGSRNGKVPGGRGSTRKGKQPEQQIPPTELLEREARVRPRAGVAAIVAGVLPLLALVLEQLVRSGAPTDGQRILSGPRSVLERAAGRPDGQGLTAAQQVALGEHLWTFAAAALLGVLASIALAYALSVVIGAVAGRRSRPVGPLAYVAPVAIVAYGVLDGVFGMVQAVRRAEIAQVPTSDLSRVRDIFDASVPPALQLVLALATALYAGSLVWTNLQAMAAGLFTRFLGILGVFGGLVVVLGGIGLNLDQVGLLRAFWAIAVGVLLLGRWPRGEPAAWSDGIAKPWPTRAEQVEQLERDRAKAQRERERDGEGDDDDPAPRRPEGGGRRGRKR